MKNNLISNKIKNKYNKIIKEYNEDLKNFEDDIIKDITISSIYEGKIEGLYTDIFLENYKLNKNNIELYYYMRKGLDIALNEEKINDLKILFDKAKTKKDIKKLIGKYSFYEEKGVSYEKILEL